MCTGACERATLAIMLPQLLHGLRVAEQPEGGGPRGRLGRPIELQRRGDQLAQRAEVDGLRDEVERAELERPHRRLDVAVRGDHGHRHAGAVRLDPLDEVEPVAVGQPHVGEDEAVALPAEQADGAGVVGRRVHRELHPPERDAQQLADVGFVVDDEGAGVMGVASVKPRTRRRPRSTEAIWAESRCPVRSLSKALLRVTIRGTSPRRARSPLSRFGKRTLPGASANCRLVVIDESGTVEILSWLKALPETIRSGRRTPGPELVGPDSDAHQISPLLTTGARFGSSAIESSLGRGFRPASASASP